VNVSELGLVTPAGKVVWGKIICYLYFGCRVMFKFQLILMHWILFAMNAGKYAQVTNNPENDGCINAVLLV
jgi:ribosome biogenesis protein NSA2